MAIENDKYIARKNVIITLMGIMFVCFLLQLIHIQLIDDSYAEKAEDNALLRKINYPARGLIYDRNGELLVYNKPAYDVTVVMNEVKNFDTLDFCHAVNITPEQFRKLIKKIKGERGYSKYTPQRLLSQLSMEEYAVLQEKLYKFPGFDIQQRTLREYKYPCAAHALGSVGEVTQEEIDGDEEKYYSRGDYAGRNGVEKFYEKELRGIKGYNKIMRDAHGRLKGKYKNGAEDRKPVSGKNIEISLDISLQLYGEKLMKNKIGSVVAIEPQTGEVLALVSSPSYNPSELVGRQRGKNFNRLLHDPLKPLLDRPLTARYPPGSTFKVLQSLIFQQEGIITPNTRFGCSRGATFGGHHQGCHSHPSPLDMRHALQTSCNAYFSRGLCMMFDNRRKYKNIQEAFEIWKDDVVSFGFGYKTGIDFPTESRGFIPNSETYNKIYGKKGWRGSTIVSIAIGQGEVTVTPLQLANYASALANKGYWITPHIVRKIDGGKIDPKYREKHVTKIDPKYFEATIDGMEMAVQGGTGRVAQIDSMRVCAKTGTAQNPGGKDHSIFMAFAPREDPKIAIVVVVENAGFGATWAGPVASLMMERYLRGRIPERKLYLETKLSEANLIPTNARPR